MAEDKQQVATMQTDSVVGKYISIDIDSFNEEDRRDQTWGIVSETKNKRCDMKKNSEECKSSKRKELLAVKSTCTLLGSVAN